MQVEVGQQFIRKIDGNIYTVIAIKEIVGKGTLYTTNLEGRIRRYYRDKFVAGWTPAKTINIKFNPTNIIYVDFTQGTWKKAT